jgi:hypothetical protein
MKYMYTMRQHLGACHMATERVPTEIWIKILRHAISVPLFLDTDPTESYGVEAMIGGYDDPTL